MKKTTSKADNDMRAEYDFASLTGGVRGKYVDRLRHGTNIVLIEPSVAEAFPTEQSVNEAPKGCSTPRGQFAAEGGCLIRRGSRQAARGAH